MCKSDISFSLFVNIIHWYSLSFSHVTRQSVILGGKQQGTFSFFQTHIFKFFGAFCEALLVFLDTCHVCELMLRI